MVWILMVYLDFCCEFEPGEEFADRKSQGWISLYVDMLPPVGHNLSLARFKDFHRCFLEAELETKTQGCLNYLEREGKDNTGMRK
jgi:hypothetical protein